jgi:uncharacterized protein (UPF0261 family)
LEHNNIRKLLWQHSFSPISLSKILRHPLGGFSGFDRKGGPSHDQEGPEFFEKALKKHLRPGTPLHLLPYHINEPEFSEAIIESLEQVLKMKIKLQERR